MRLFIYGAGGHARVVAATAEAVGLEVAGFFDDDQSKVGSDLDGYPVLGSYCRGNMVNGALMVVAIGDNNSRRRIAEFVNGAVAFATVVHPSAIVHRTATFGEGSVACAGVVVQPGATIGTHVILNTAASVDHDCTIGDFAHIAPGCRLAGNVTVDDGALLGIGVAVVPGIRIGAGAVVGAGSVVIRDVEPGAKVMGVPARPFSQSLEK